MKLSKYLLSDYILIGLEEQEKEKALLRIAGFLKNKGLIKNVEGIYSKLIEREKIQSTAIGNGVAIPHCFSEEIENLIIVIVISRRGIDFNSPDKKPIKLIFLILGNKKNPGLHLKALARIARLIKETEIIKKLIDCSNVQEVLRIFEEEEGKI
ncbi:PTS sugar transporter subunit IIA [Candidatus Aminicenantes bacterium AC-708-M15]|jgi:mannitol/fructose-specific phosphotransferase system IIA component (Ntr-type)|nr:PTS sugar transporter subunit IIA [SCandidatus Aminicenantes bacterium Aminicenantia_JdfR_composite]MCP2597158.1 PTS sugar transporter subunit IIA [Candidatus Aminicenantes bacterium AC-335-G13]MCP2604441.1 PTS sugar transporter subunit IIA [Candidatus Aminicenantes bacterium AC-708-M15]